LSYGVHIFTDDYLVLSQSTLLTDGQTDVDSQTVRVHSQSYGKNCSGSADDCSQYWLGNVAHSSPIFTGGLNKCNIWPL